MKPKMSPGQLEAVGRFFFVLSEPGRLGLLLALVDGPLTVNELVEASGMKQPNVSKHRGVLHQHGLVKRERKGVCIRYEVADAVVFELCGLVRGRVAGEGSQSPMAHRGWGVVREQKKIPD